MRTSVDVYTKADELIGRALNLDGFERAQEGEYLRSSAEGLDRVLVDADDRKKKFSVLLGFYPRDMEVLTGLLDGADRGFPCGPYLTPVGMYRRPHLWSYKTDEHIRMSLQEVIRALDEVGLPWLKRLRDPVVYAEAVDPEALFDSALAYERVGEIDRARKIYLSLLQRFQQMFAYTDERNVMEEVGKQFVFVAEKLGEDEDRVKRFREQLHYDSPIERLM